MNQPRPYTMSEEALAQRRAAARNSTGPTSDEGKAISSRNAWKHGAYSPAANINLQLVAGQPVIFGRPCLSTCPKHPDQKPAVPCSLVTGGHTQAGGDCLDKEVYVRVFDALMQSLQTGQLDGMESILAANMAGAMEVLQMLRMEIVTHGVVRSLPAFNADGQVVLHDGQLVPAKLIANPALAHYILMLDKLGISLTELLATPKSKHNAKTDDEKADALQEFLGAALGHGGARPRRAPIDGELDNAD